MDVNTSVEEKEDATDKKMERKEIASKVNKETTDCSSVSVSQSLVLFFLTTVFSFIPRERLVSMFGILFLAINALGRYRSISKLSCWGIQCVFTWESVGSG